MTQFINMETPNNNTVEKKTDVSNNERKRKHCTNR